MIENDKRLLDELIKSRKETIAPDSTEPDFFEYFVPEIILKDYNLSAEEIEEGIVGDGGDGGIDSIYIFVENSIINGDEYDFSGTKYEPLVEVIIIQAKTSDSFSESTINKFIATFSDLLNLQQDLKELDSVYNSSLIEKAYNLRNTILQLTSKFPKIKFSFYYVTRGDSTTVHPNVLRKVTILEKKVKENLSTADFLFKFYGATDLLLLSRKAKVNSRKLKVKGNIISEGEGLVCLVRLSDFYNFITDENQNRIHSIFDTNVREYEGAVEVNQAIKDTLQNEKSKINFWWLNNGITIVAAKAPLYSEELVLENPKVVNGLQTSQEISEYFSLTKNHLDERLILVRVIVTNDENIRNQILKATNNQTRIVSYSLRVTEKIHFDIEQFLMTRGYYYDRQKNFYKNQDKPKEKIVSMQFIAQCFAAVILQEPNNARGRPASLIKDDKKYSQIFNENFDLSIYLKTIELVKKIDNYLKKVTLKTAKNERMNLRFHLSSMTALYLFNGRKISPDKFVKKFDMDCISEKMLQALLRELLRVFTSIKREMKLDGNRVARRKEFDSRIKEKVLEMLRN